MATQTLAYNSGDRYHLVTLTGKAYRHKSRLWVEGICDCGTIKFFSLGSLLSGHSKSCGCIKVKHRLTSHSLYSTWNSIYARCNYPSHESYKDYGAKGVSMCKEWEENFIAFYNWAMGNGWQKGLTIDRKDNDLNYCPDNCRCATPAQQNRNKRNNVMLSAFGETKCKEDWVNDDRCVVTRTTLMTRINELGWSVEKALTYPSRNIVGNGMFRDNSIKIKYKGKEQNLSEWCKELDVKYDTVRNRIKGGWDCVRALETPVLEKYINKINRK